MEQLSISEPDTPDYYEDLGLHKEATPEAIKRAFHKLAKLHHPDKQAPGTCTDAQEFRKAGSEAFMVTVMSRMKKSLTC